MLVSWSATFSWGNILVEPELWNLSVVKNGIFGLNTCMWKRNLRIVSNFGQWSSGYSTHLGCWRYSVFQSLFHLSILRQNSLSLASSVLPSFVSCKNKKSEWRNDMEIAKKILQAGRTVLCLALCIIPDSFRVPIMGWSLRRIRSLD